jgi:ssDNA-binding Zn-finger/Zn-ribbon topoisomerase 1
MASQVALKVKCPVCRKSLMDKAHQIDGHSAIGLRVDVRGKKGWLRLSPVYGSYKVESEFPIAQDALVKISCPHCQAALKSSNQCEVCGAPMAPLMLEEGGKMFICSRRGCKKHFLEFEDINGALAKFHDAYPYSGKPAPASGPDVKPRESEKEVLPTGTFLQSYCPHCQRSLIDRNSIKFIVVNKSGREGDLMINPYLNVFTNRSTIEIPEGEQVRDLKCPHCRHSLIEKGRRCDKCGSPTAKITVSAMQKLISFYVCLRKGCFWHGLSDKDTKLIILEDSPEW